ncbi:hypothetical protein PO909_032445 [Leuciscus waleckii]
MSVGRDRSNSGEFNISFLEYQFSMQISSTIDHDKLMLQFWVAQVRPGPGPGLSHARSIYNRAVPTTFPLSEAKFQKIVLTKLVTLTDEVIKLQRSVPHSGIEITRMDTLEEFQRELASLLETHKFETLVRSFQPLMPIGVMRNAERSNRKTGLIISAFHFSTHLQW